VLKRSLRIAQGLCPGSRPATVVGATNTENPKATKKKNTKEFCFSCFVSLVPFVLVVKSAFAVRDARPVYALRRSFAAAISA
jgi:hypothetical protein